MHTKTQGKKGFSKLSPNDVGHHVGHFDDHSKRSEPATSNIQVIGAGMPRTGTLSLKIALEKLGYVQCYHMVDLMQNLEQVDDWLRISRGEPVDWEHLLQGYQAIVDIPGQRYYQDLLRAYPKAKVILTTRDPERWYESVRQTIYQAHQLSTVERDWWWLRYPLSPMRRHKVLLGSLIGQIMWEDYFAQRFSDKNFVLDVYETHLYAVKAHVPAEQLLTFDVAEGWQPLCDFLKVAIPSQDTFPYANDREHFRQFWQSPSQSSDVSEADLVNTPEQSDTTPALLIQTVAQHAKQAPHKTALVAGDTVLDYQTLYAQSLQIAQRLRQHGLETGDRVAIYLPNGIEFVSSYLGIQQAGAVAMAINTALTATEIDYILQDSQARWVITTAALQTQIDRSAHPALACVWLIDEASECAKCAEPAGTVNSLLNQTVLNDLPTNHLSATIGSVDDPALVLYSSGTTGKPKGAVISHGNLMASARSVSQGLSLTPEDRVLIFLPLFHSYALTTMLGSALYSQARVVILPEFAAQPLLETVSQQQITTFFAVPTIYTILLEQAQPACLQSVRQYLSAGANLPSSTAKQWQKKFGVALMDGLGFTEGSHVSLNPHPIQKPGSVGLPLAGIRIQVVNEAGQVCPPNEPGEITVYGPTIMLGYWNQPQTALRKGWFYSGDRGYLDDDGYLYVIDRYKDMINVGGEKVYPNEVEQVLYQHPAIAEAAVYGIPHATLGETVKAGIVLKPEQHVSVTAQQLIDFCRVRLAHYKLPSVIDFRVDLPKGRTGKVLKRVLRDQDQDQIHHHDLSSSTQALFQQQLKQAASSAERTALLKQRLEADIYQLLGQTLSADQNLFAAGMDSLMAIQLANQLSITIGMQLPSTLAMEHITLNQLTGYLAAFYEASAPERRQIIPQHNHNKQPAFSTAEGQAWDIKQWFPQSAIQRLYYDWHQAADNKAFMNMSFIAHVRSTINPVTLKDALQQLVESHPGLSLNYALHQGIPMQKVHPNPVAFFDARQVVCNHWEALQDELLAISRQPFDLSQDAMMRVYLFSRSRQDHLLLIVRHHIMNDRTTAVLTVEALLKRYQALQIQIQQSTAPVRATENSASTSTENTYTACYLEFLQWQHDFIQSPAGQASKAYWQQQLGPQPVRLQLPTDFPRYPNNRHYGTAYNVDVHTVLTAALKQLAQQQGVTLYAVMMSAYQVLFHCLTGQQDISVDTSMINRTEARFEKTLGQLSTLHTIRSFMTEETTFQTLLQQVQTTLREALQHQSYPGHLVASTLPLAHAPVYKRPGQVLFNLVSAHFPPLSFSKLSQYGITLEPSHLIPSGSAGTFHEINTQFLEKEGQLSGHINYETDLYRPETIAKLMADYQKILQQITHHPEQPIAFIKKALSRSDD